MVFLDVRCSALPIGRTSCPGSSVAKWIGLVALACLSLGVVSPAVSYGQAAPAGHWSLLRTELSEYKAPPKGSSDYPNYLVLWRSSEGKVQATLEGFIDPAQSEKQTLTAQFSWQKPPRSLTPGTDLQMSLIVSILFNSHPEKGLGWGGQGDITFGNTLRLTDKDSKYIVGFGNFGTPVQSLIYTTTGTARLVGKAKVPVATWREARQEDGKKLLDLRVNMVFNNQPCSYDYVYAWKSGPAPLETPSTPAAEPASSPDIAGAWQHGDGGETWTLTPLGNGEYKAVEKGFANAQGTATKTARGFQIEYTTGDGKTTGRYVVSLAADGMTGAGKYEDSTGTRGARTFVRKTPAGSSPGSASPMTPKEPAQGSGMTIQAGRRSVRAGQTVTVPIWLVNVGPLASMNVNVDYDDSVAKTTGAVAKGNLVDKAMFEANPRESGRIRLGFAQSRDLAGTGTLAQIPFQAVGKPGDRTPLRVTVTLASGAGGAKVQPATLDGEIVIVGDNGVLPGDTTGTGTLTAVDAMNALKMSVGNLPVNLVADMDADRQVTARDSTLILQKVVGK